SLPASLLPPTAEAGRLLARPRNRPRRPPCCRPLAAAPVGPAAREGRTDSLRCCAAGPYGRRAGSLPGARPPHPERARPHRAGVRRCCPPVRALAAVAEGGARGVGRTARRRPHLLAPRLA